MEADQTGASALDASMAAVLLYDRALTAGEIAHLAQAKPGGAQAATKPRREGLLGTLANGRVADTMRKYVIPP